MTLAAATSSVLGAKVFTDIVFTVIIFLHRRRAAEKENKTLPSATKCIFSAIAIACMIPIIGAIWPFFSYMDGNGKVSIVMCALSIVLGQSAMILGPWRIFKCLHNRIYFRCAAVFTFTAVACMDSYGLHLILQIAPNFLGIIFFSIGNGLSFIYLLSIFPLLAWKSILEKAWRSIFWAWSFSLLFIIALVTVPVYCRNEWGILGTLSVSWSMLFPWMVVVLWTFLDPETDQIQSSLSNQELGILDTTNDEYRNPTRSANALKYLDTASDSWSTTVNILQTSGLSRSEFYSNLERMYLSVASIRNKQISVEHGQFQQVIHSPTSLDVLNNLDYFWRACHNALTKESTIMEDCKANEIKGAFDGLRISLAASKGMDDGA